MQNQTSPLILSFGVSDPVGAIGIQADLATFSAFGCHGLSVTTGLLISDTARVEDVQAVDPDWVSDQARVLLEDMSVAAIKIGALGIFLMRQYIGTAIPKDLIEAARIDGCGEFAIYWRVVLPLIGPAMGTLGLITFINSWNNFITPLVVMRSVENYTIPLALRSMQAPNNTEWGALMTGAAIAVLPLLLMFFVASKRLIEGLTQGAVKG